MIQLLTLELKLSRCHLHKHEKYRLLSLMLFFTFVFKADAQNYIWPTDASHYLTSTFAEYRQGHFHAGIDIKTNAQCGYRLFAVDSGSVVRLSVSPYYYGKAVFLQMDRGGTAVYAHLSRFSEELEAVARSAQKNAGRYGIDIQDSAGFNKVTAGQVIGYSGRTGTEVPHLHFEIDSSGWAVNPLISCFSVEDTIAPVFTSIAATPLTYGSHVQGDFEPCIFHVRLRDKNHYQITDTVYCSGPVGLAVSVYDLANGAPNRLNIYSLRLEMDGMTIFTRQYNRFKFSETGQVNLDRNYRLNRRGAGLFHNLYREPGSTSTFDQPDIDGAGLICGNSGSEKLSWQSSERKGMLELNKGDHFVRIFAADIMGNSSEIQGFISVQSEEEFHLQQRHHDISIPENRMVKEQQLSQIEYDFFKDYIRVFIRIGQAPLYPPILTACFYNWTDLWIPLYRKGSTGYTGQIPLTHPASGLLTTALRYASYTGDEVTVHDTLSVFSVSNEASGSIYSEDGRLEVYFPKGSLYQPFMGTVRSDHSTVPNAESETYFLFPDDIPMKDDIVIRVELSDKSDDHDRLGIYQVDDPARPVFLGKDHVNGYLQANTSTPGAYAVIRDTMPPECFLIRPDPGSQVSTGPGAIAIFAKDTLSGIYGEDSYTVRLNNVRQIVAYDPHENCMYCDLPMSTKPGPDTLFFSVTDQAGNVTENTTVFYIPERSKESP